MKTPTILVHRNGVDLSPVEVKLNKARRNDIAFSPIKTTSKKFDETTW